MARDERNRESDRQDEAHSAGNADDEPDPTRLPLFLTLFELAAADPVDVCKELVPGSLEPASIDSFPFQINSEEAARKGKGQSIDEHVRKRLFGLLIRAGFIVGNAFE